MGEQIKKQDHEIYQLENKQPVCRYNIYEKSAISNGTKYPYGARIGQTQAITSGYSDGVGSQYPYGVTVFW